MNKLLLALLIVSSSALADSWESSINNWDNSPNNWNNSPNNWDNSPNNWNNSPNNWNNPNIVRDANGNAAGYIVHKPEGGANIYDFKGNRQGYIPKR